MSVKIYDKTEFKRILKIGSDDKVFLTNCDEFECARGIGQRNIMGLLPEILGIQGEVVEVVIGKGFYGKSKVVVVYEEV